VDSTKLNLYKYKLIYNTKLNNIPANTKTNKKTIENKSNNFWINLSKTFLDATLIQRAKLPSISSWGTLLKSFCSREGIDKAKIKKILTWYCTQFDKKKNPYFRKYLPKFVPQANSMRGFIDKFYNIEIAMLRNEDSDENENIILSKQETIYLKKMKYNLSSIPQAKYESLPHLVSKLLRGLDNFLSGLQKSALSKKIQQLYIDSFLNSDIFFVEYSMWIANEIKTWPNWGGDFRVFSPGEKHFKRFVENVLRRKELTIKSLEGILNETENN
jgi:hypothetical protein